MLGEGERSRDELLPAYMRSLRRIPNVGHDAIDEMLAELARLRALGDEGWRDVRDRVAMHHLRMVVNIARRLHYGQLPLLDLIQEGNLGLMRAVEGFDIERGAAFPTYAGWWIRRNVLRALEDQGRTIRVSSTGWALDRRVRGYERERSVRCGDRPSSEEVADALEVAAVHVDCLRGAIPGALSCETTISADGLTIGDSLDDPSAQPPDRAVADGWLRRAVVKGLSEIGERERGILVLRWGIGGVRPLTQTQIGRRLGISGARVCQIEKLALARLRRCPIFRSLKGLW